MWNGTIHCVILAKPYKLKTMVAERAKDILKRDAGHVYAGLGNRQPKWFLH